MPFSSKARGTGSSESVRFYSRGDIYEDEIAGLCWAISVDKARMKDRRTFEPPLVHSLRKFQETRCSVCLTHVSEITFSLVPTDKGDLSRFNRLRSNGLNRRMDGAGDGGKAD